MKLSTELLLTHQPLLLLTPLLLAVFAVTSLPFLTLLIRLGTIGYWRHPREDTWIFHIRPYAGWLIFVVTLIWVWTWGVIRGVGKVAVAAVVGEWYFHRLVYRTLICDGRLTSAETSQIIVHLWKSQQLLFFEQLEPRLVAFVWALELWPSYVWLAV
jgi:hypothetical protein